MTTRRRKVKFADAVTESELNNNSCKVHKDEVRNMYKSVILVVIFLLLLSVTYVYLFVEWNTIKGYILNKIVLPPTTLKIRKDAKKASSPVQEPSTEEIKKVATKKDLPPNQDPLSSKTKTKSTKSTVKKPYAKAHITSKADDNIRTRLDEIDFLLKKKLAEEANRKVDAILNKNPNSPRGLYSKSLALDQLAEIKRSNVLLEQSFDFLHKIIDMSLEYVPDDLMLMAGALLTKRLEFRGWTGKILAVQKKLLIRFPGNTTLLNQFGTTYMLLGQLEKARKIYLKVLENEPDNGFANAHYGFIVKTEDLNYKQAIPLLKKGIASKEEGTQHGRFFFHLGDALYRIGQPEEAVKVYEQGASLGLFPSKDQRSMYNCGQIKATPWWTIKETTYAKQMKVLSDNWKVIRDEGLAQVKNGLFKDEDENLLDHGDWKQLTLFGRGQKIEAACHKVPKTCKLLEQVPAATSCKRGQIKFSIMQPGVHVWPHTGPTNCRLRAHLGLVVPPGLKLRVVNETRTWREGKFIVFDDSFDHEVWHDGKSLRLVLIVDFWHPQITADERRRTTPI